MSEVLPDGQTRFRLRPRIEKQNDGDDDDPNDREPTLRELFIGSTNVPTQPTVICTYFGSCFFVVVFFVPHNDEICSSTGSEKNRRG